MTMRALLVALITALIAGCASMAGAGGPAKVADAMWVDANGRTLYTFDRDTAGSGRSVCNGPCATNWPPLAARVDAKAGGDWAVIARDDGGRQWAYKGKPLYTWIKDQKPGDKTGDGVNNAWRIARP
jgi:predicted lipoprotein with Yx(FWY)xxD motif